MIQIQKTAIKDDFLKTVFGIEVLGVTESDGEITLSFFGSGHRDIVIQTNPLSETGSGSTITQEVFEDLL